MKWLLLFICLIHNSRCDFHCNNPFTDLGSTSVHQNESFHIRSKRAPQNIRIARYYDDSYNTMPNKDSITQLVLDPAIQFWQNTLSVYSPLTTPLIIDRACAGTHNFVTVNNNRLKVCSSSCAMYKLCFTTPIPDQYLQSCYTNNLAGGYSTSGSAGIGSANTDLLLIITHKTDGCTGNVLAYALACELEHTLDRPVIGLVNICPGKINTNVGLKMSIATLKHELAHVLGMSSNLFAFWRSQTGVPLTPRDAIGIPNLGQKSLGSVSIYQYSDNTVKDFIKTFNYHTGPISKTVSYMVTPTVQTEMRKYFNCSTVEGMMLEDYGSSSSALSHFEKLYLQNELMTASISINAQASRLTLAVLQDTGWYVANFDKADNFIFAKNIGCDFVTKSCHDYIRTQQSLSKPLYPFCDEPLTVSAISCSSDARSQIYCNLIDNSTVAAQVPFQYRYFSNKNLVSSDPFSDFCPLIQIHAMTDSGKYIYTGECTDPQNTAVQGSQYDYFNQGFGTNAVCVGFNKPTNWYYESCKSMSTPSIQGAGCYKYECQPNYGLVIVVNNYKYQCRVKDQVIDVTSRNTYLIPHGKLKCPDCSAICGSALCGSATLTLAVQCNNVDRPCPGVVGYTAPCSTSTLTLGLIPQVTLIIITLLLNQ